MKNSIRLGGPARPVCLSGFPTGCRPRDPALYPPLREYVLPTYGARNNGNTSAFLSHTKSHRVLGADAAVVAAAAKHAELLAAELARGGLRKLAARCSGSLFAV